MEVVPHPVPLDNRKLTTVQRTALPGSERVGDLENSGQARGDQSLHVQFGRRLQITRCGRVFLATSVVDFNGFDVKFGNDLA